MKEYFKISLKYAVFFLKWLALGIVIGAIGGMVGSFFHHSIDAVTHIREGNFKIIYFLPVGGVAIAAMYRAFRKKGCVDTNRVLLAARENGKVPIIMVPLIFISATITHLFGGSAGREGAALQIGGGIGYNAGKLLKLSENDLHIATMSGMSAVFAALFGTPLTAAIFALEVVSVGALNYAGFLPCIAASVSAYLISLIFGVVPVRFTEIAFETLAPDVILKVILLSLLSGILSTIFCTAIKKAEKSFDKIIPNCYLRAFLGGTIIVILTLLVGTQDYNGAGMTVIARAVLGEARVWDFALKMIFTVVTIAAGFKGGEIVPTLFIGSTFGCALASILGLDAGLCAAIGMIAMFCGVVNCPIASIFLSIELFGAEGLLFFAIACAVSYIVSGYSGLYKSQKIIYSKLNSNTVEEDVR